ncbi:hypothetical protein JTB14_015161 [Gonioctena quinquepunctata]|nr:hypothetical protein JTB14_015161 [Gonioctena quinquepunctata]
MEEIGHLREFSLRSSEWSIFKPRLMSHFSANGIKEDTGSKKMRAILLNTCDEAAFKLIFDLVSPSKPEDKTSAQLAAIFDWYFSIVHLPYDTNPIQPGRSTTNQWAGRLRGSAVVCEVGMELAWPFA